MTGAGAAADVGWLVIYLFRNACQSSGGPGQGWFQCESDKNAEVKIIHILTVFKHREKKQKNNNRNFMRTKGPVEHKFYSATMREKNEFL